MKSSERTRFSINLQEDFLIYGIDPNDKLDDWSFLDEKPEPIPEKTEEERELFEQLLKPTILEEEVNKDINERLKNLLRETTELISKNQEALDDHFARKSTNANSVVDLEQVNIDKESPEYSQANRVRSIVQSMLRTTEKADDMTSFIENVTKSDKIALQTLNIPENVPSVSSARFLPPASPRIQKEKEKTSDIQNTKTEIINETLQNVTQVAEKPKPLFFANFIKKITENQESSKTIDETERLSTKFMAERKKREEVAAKEVERRQKEIEDKSNAFLKSIEEEVIKKEREDKFVSEIKSRKPATVSEMLDQIKHKDPQVSNEKTAPKGIKEEPKLNTQDIIKEYNDKRNAAMISNEMKHEPVISVSLLSSKLKPIQPKYHESKTYLSNVYKSLREFFTSSLKKKKEATKIQSALTIAVFIKMTLCIKRNNKCKYVQQRIHFFKWLLLFRKRRTLDQLKFAFSAAIINTFVKRNLTRKMKALQEKQKKTQKIKKDIMEYIIPEFDGRDLDTSWLEKFKDDSDFESFLDELEDRKHSNIVEPSLPKIVAESQSVPLEDGIDDYLAKFQGNNATSETVLLDKVRKEVQSIVKKNRDSDSKSTSSISPVRQSQTSMNAPSEESTEINSLQEQAQREGYNFNNPQTAELMERMRNRRKQNNHKNEKPVERFKRLYGINSQINPESQNQKPNIMHFKRSDNRTKRLQKLQRAWFDGARKELEQGLNTE